MALEGENTSNVPQRHHMVRCFDRVENQSPAAETTCKLGLNEQRGRKLSRSEVKNSEREQRCGREQLSLRKAAYIPTGLRRKAADSTATISCVCY